LAEQPRGYLAICRGQASGRSCSFRSRTAKEGNKVGIGGSILLIAVGAIFAFAIQENLGWLDLNVVGWVLMLVGLACLLFTTWFWQSRRRTVVEAPVRETYPTVRETRVPVQEDRVVEEYREVRRTDPPL
jgi:hypothetical protein